jgi:recombination protein RecT
MGNNADGAVAVRPGMQMQPKSAVGSISTISKLLKDPAVKALVGKGMSSAINFENLAKMAITTAQRMPKLLNCTQESFIFALMTAGQLGLDPSGITGRAYIIPYGNKAQFQMGYRGYIDLVCRSGMAKAVSVYVVWDDEADSMKWDSNSAMRHVPNFKKKRDYTVKGSKDIAFFYMVADHGNDVRTFSFMTIDEVEDIRTRFSKQSKGKAWTDSYTEMGKKTMIIRGTKTLPMSTERTRGVESGLINRAMVADQEAEEAEYEEIVIDPSELPVTEKIPESDKPKAGSVNENRTPISKWKADYTAEKITYSDWEASRDQYPDDERKEFENWVAVQP